MAWRHIIILSRDCECCETALLGLCRHVHNPQPLCPISRLTQPLSCLCSGANAYWTAIWRFVLMCKVLRQEAFRAPTLPDRCHRTLAAREPPLVHCAVLSGA